MTPLALRRYGKATAYGALNAIGGFALLRWMHRTQVPILCYHSVLPQPAPPMIAMSGLHIDARKFRRHMEFVARHYKVVPLSDVIQAMHSDAPLPEGSLVLTFDDGYANNLHVAAPILEQLGLPATIFIATDYVGTERLYWWDELPLLIARGEGRKIDAAGWKPLDLTTPVGVQKAFSLGHSLLATADLATRRSCLSALEHAVGGQHESSLVDALRPATWDELRSAPGSIHFGGHTASHRLLDGIDIETATADCTRCREELRLQLGLDGELPFCYPQGRWTPEVKTMLRSLGFNTALWATDVRAEERLFDGSSDVMQVPRIGVHSAMDVNILSANAAGFRSLLGRVL